MDGLKRKFTSIAKARRTEEVYKRKFAEVAAVWKEFEENNTEIEKGTEESAEKKEYNEKEYFNAIKSVKEQLETFFKAEFAKSFPDGNVEDVMAASKDVSIENIESEDESEYEDKNITNKSTERNDTFRDPAEYTDRVYRVRASMLDNLVTKLVLKHADHTTEIELDHDLGKLEEASRLYTTSYEDRVMTADDEFEMEGLSIEHEELINVADRAILSFKRKLAEFKHSKNSEPEAPKLQSLKVPKFTGLCHQWVPFYNLFNRTVIQNPKLTDVQRMQYLMDCLEGEPKKLIQHLEIADDNFTGAMDIIMRRYNDQRKIINTHIDAIVDHANIADDVMGLKSLHDKTIESLHALKGQNVSDKALGNVILTRLIEKKLSSQTRRGFEENLIEKRKMPKLEELMHFIEARFVGMESIASSPIEAAKGDHRQDRDCALCPKQRHRIHQCQKFNGMSPFERCQAIRKTNLCQNCLKDHGRNKCTMANNCKKCTRFHHTSLHYERRDDAVNFRQNAQSHVVCTEKISFDVMLATAIINAKNSYGEYIELRTLIDQGSTTSFISEDAIQRLKLPRTRNSTEVTGIGASKAGKIHGCASICIKPRYPSTFEVPVDALILEKLTTYDANSNDDTKWDHLQGLILADPTYYKSGAIDMIIGADIFATIVLDRVIRGPPNTPIAQETTLGWILSGRVQRKTTHSAAVSLITDTCINSQLEKFWNIEEIKSDSMAKFTAEERECEDFFTNTHVRSNDGKYTTRLPFKSNEFVLGKSRHIAVATLLQMEKKFKANPKLKQEYAKCINEYLELGHMKLARDTDESLVTIKNGERHYNCYYMPHHAVFKASSTTTKLRVVFNASQKTANGTALNDTMMVGPTIQDDLMNILLRWRGHRIALASDIEKMYRQILVDKDDWNYQRIVWRNSESEPIRDYCLQRITFGNAAAPFMAIRTVQQLAKDEQGRFPLAASAALSDFYVDDLMTGAHTVEKAVEMQHQLRKIMNAGGMSLRKWASNNLDALDGVPNEHRELKTEIAIDTDDTLKMLGVQWDPRRDEFRYKINLGPAKNEYTKRELVSEVARLFDPLGWLTPVVIMAKIRLQQTWLAGIGWDEKIPTKMEEEWKEFRATLLHINNIKIPRYVGLGFDDVEYELHGFCDASMKAYAAVVFLKCKNKNGNVSVNIVAAKSRVAPVKTISLPRLELCGAVLLSELTAKIQDAWKRQMKIFAWTDSLITLAWITGNVQRWETFVANRVIKIREHISSENWRHVGTKENPADVASRGVDAEELQNHSLWWHGPAWLAQSEIVTVPIENLDTTEGTKRVRALHITTDSTYQDTIRRFSSLDKAKRVLAVCLRFAKNCRGERMNGPITVREIRKATTALIRWAQSIDFAEEINQLSKGEEIHKKSSILALNPFLDENGLLRVGGRIQNQEMTYDRRHPALIAYGNILTQLIIRDAHLKTLHGGNTLTLSFIRQNFWILKAKRAVKTVLRSCVKCFKFRAEVRQQQMGNLPIQRTTQCRPFTNTGVDFCGPFDIKISGGRGCKTRKGYIAVFVCLVTRAVHIEVVSDLTSQAFIAAMKRMMSRRGLVSQFFSDNGTNFVGADRIIQEEFATFKRQYGDEITSELARMGAEWHFIPPASPNFGGIWESGVKSVKYHLKRTIGEAKLTYEEMATVLNQIEACLNSRPICPISADPDDLQVLTPGHFLTGESLLLPPEPDLSGKSMQRLDRWKMCQRIKQDFWNIWSNEFLTRLQQRTKWLTKERNLATNDMVLVKDERLAAGSWPLGRIIDTYPGKDGLVRVVDVRIGQKTFRRPANKICLLPIEDNNESIAGGKDDDVKSSSKSMTPPNTPLLVFLIVFLGMIAAAAGSSAINIHSFNNNTIAYVEKIGDSQIVNGDWNILVYYDLRNYFNEFNLIYEGLARTEKKCDEVGFDCTELIKQFAHRLHGIQEKNALLKGEYGGARTKRQIVAAMGGLIAGGMAAYSWLKPHEGNEYAQAINALKTNQNHILDLMRKQTSVLDLTDDTLKRNLRQMETIHKNLRDNVDRLAQAAERAELGWKLHDIALQYSIMLEIYADIQNRFIDTTIAVHSGNLYPTLVSPTKIEEQMKLIRRHIGPDLDLPDTVAHVYQMARVKVRLSDNKLIFRVSIPILRKDTFRVWQIIPIPQTANGTFMELQTSADYFLVSRDNNTFCEMTKTERNACHDIDNKLVCRIRHPLYKFGASVGRCEMELIRNGTAAHTHCHGHEVARSDRWIRLTDLHSWIFVTTTSKEYNITCNDSTQTVELLGAGVLHLNGNCTLEGAHTQIASSQLTTKFTTGHSVPSNISMIFDRNQIIHDSSTERINMTELDAAIKILSEDSSIKLLDVSIHDWHHYIIQYGGILVAVSLYFVHRCKSSQTNIHINKPPV